MFTPELRRSLFAHDNVIKRVIFRRLFERLPACDKVEQKDSQTENIAFLKTDFATTIADEEFRGDVAKCTSHHLIVSDLTGVGREAKVYQLQVEV